MRVRDNWYSEKPIIGSRVSRIDLYTMDVAQEMRCNEMLRQALIDLRRSAADLKAILVELQAIQQAYIASNGLGKLTASSLESHTPTISSSLTTAPSAARSVADLAVPITNNDDRDDAIVTSNNLVMTSSASPTPSPTLTSPQDTGCTILIASSENATVMPTTCSMFGIGLDAVTSCAADMFSLMEVVYENPATLEEHSLASLPWLAANLEVTTSDVASFSKPGISSSTSATAPTSCTVAFMFDIINTSSVLRIGALIRGYVTSLDDTHELFEVIPPSTYVSDLIVKDLPKHIKVEIVDILRLPWSHYPWVFWTSQSTIDTKVVIVREFSGCYFTKTNFLGASSLKHGQGSKLPNLPGC